MFSSCLMKSQGRQLSLAVGAKKERRSAGAAECRTAGALEDTLGRAAGTELGWLMFSRPLWLCTILLGPLVVIPGYGAPRSPWAAVQQATTEPCDFGATFHPARQGAEQLKGQNGGQIWGELKRRQSFYWGLSWERPSLEWFQLEWVLNELWFLVNDSNRKCQDCHP